MVRKFPLGKNARTIGFGARKGRHKSVSRVVGEPQRPIGELLGWTARPPPRRHLSAGARSLGLGQGSGPRREPLPGPWTGRARFFI